MSAHEYTFAFFARHSAITALDVPAALNSAQLELNLCQGSWRDYDEPTFAYLLTRMGGSEIRHPIDPPDALGSRGSVTIVPAKQP